MELRAILKLIVNFKTPLTPPTVVNQYYNPGILDQEYVMRGNAAILKCSIPSFVADFVYVVAWIDSDGDEYVPSNDKNFTGGKKQNSR